MNKSMKEILASEIKLCQYRIGISYEPNFVNHNEKIK